jgi:hypothetical protein
LNGNKGNPEVYAINGLMETYKEILTKLELSGPTLFNPII